MRSVARGVALLCVIAGTTSAIASSQSAPLTIVNAGPIGEIGRLQDANEIRVIFSEPMVPLGRIPSNPTPPWIQIAPAIKGAYRWSGTTILIFTPDPASPLPNATAYTVTVDGSAAAVSGRTLGSPYQFTFTTPTVRLTSARWARRSDRFDAPVTLALTFNQRVRPADVIAHLAVRYHPHTVDLPSFTQQERARLSSTEPDGLRRFDAKIAAARNAASRADLMGTQVAAAWDQKRFPPSPNLIVLETTSVPPPGSWLQLTLDARMPGAEGPAFPPEAQTSVAELTPAFFITGPPCRTACDPADYNPVFFTEQVDAARVRRRDDGPRHHRSGARAGAAPERRQVAAAGPDTSFAHGVEDAGFDRQPPARTWLIGLNAALQARDGQTLGYPWIGIVENWHERAFTSFGDGHGVWEKDGGTQLPFYARNLQTVTQHAVVIAAGQPDAAHPVARKGRLRPDATGTRHAPQTECHDRTRFSLTDSISNRS